METSAQDLASYLALIESARQAESESRWEAAKLALEQAIAIDPLQTKAIDLLARVMSALHDPDEAESLRRRAKLLREEKWKRDVEAEIRGRHELTGAATRHEIP